MVKGPGLITVEKCEALLHEAATLLRRVATVTFPVDRGFRDKDWACTCRKLGWNYGIRVANNTRVTLADGRVLAINTLGVTPGRPGYFQIVRLTAEVECLSNAEAERVRFRQEPHDYAKTVDKGHGRLEIRECWTISRDDYREALRAHDRWAGLRSPAMVRATRQIGDEISVVTRYYISSLDGQAARFLAATRSHWGIENDLHRSLDVAFREDESRVRVGHGPENLATLRRMALNVLKQEKTAKIGLKAKRLKAGRDEAYLRRLLTAL